MLAFTGMEALACELPISVEEYLSGEEKASVRHEYLDGYVRAMAGETTSHNEIALNLAAAIREKTRGGSCRTFMEGVKVYPLPKSLSLFYYPDVMLACDPREKDPRFRRYPKLLVEVASPSTEQTDRSEKLLAYLQNETLEEYIIVAQDRPEVSVYRRSDDWQRENLSGLEAVLELRSIGLSLALAEVYDGVLK
jgi:Uma2 family endonuclease